MSISLAPRLEAKIQERVASGQYSDASEVVEEALQLLGERERTQVLHLCPLLEEALEEERRGELIDFTPALLEEISKGARERFIKGEEPDPDVSF